MGLRLVVAPARALTFALCVALSLAGVGPARAARLAIERCRARGDSVEIVGHLDVGASPKQVWSVLTDYDAMARFIPDLRRSRRIAKGFEGPIVEQVATARMLFVSSRVLTVFQMRETAPDTLRFRAIAGDFKRLRGLWVIEPRPGGRTRLTCRFGAVPRGWVPSLLLAWAARGEFEPRAMAIGREAERRARLSP